MTAAADARPKRFYRIEDDGFSPTGLSTSPWRRDAQNGVALGLLMAHTLAAQPQAGEARLARFTLDILRPAPATLTRVAWRVARAGRRVQLLEGELEAGGVIGARASALLVAPSGPAPPPQPLIPPPLPPEAAPDRPVIPRVGLETRLAERRAESASGRSSLWVRVEADIVPGAPASPIAAAIAAADFGGSSLRQYSEAWTYPNLDIAVHFARTPRGEWIHAHSEPMILGQAIAVIDHHLSDRDGRFARAHQTLYFSRRSEDAAA